MMKHIYENIIHGLCRDMKKSVKQMRKHFDDDDIHDFRLSVKKLRAFLGMVSLDSTCRRRLRIPGNIRRLFRKAGNLRDMRLFEKKALSFFTGNEKPVFFLKGLEAETSLCEKELYTHLHKNPCRDSVKAMIRKLPENDEPLAASFFYDEKKQMLQRLFAEKEITGHMFHIMRKHIKDLHVIRGLEMEYAGTASQAHFAQYHGLKNTENLAVQLGHFNDSSMLINFLSSFRFSQNAYADFDKVENFRQHCIHEREMQRINLLKQLNNISL